MATKRVAPRTKPTILLLLNDVTAKRDLRPDVRLADELQNFADIVAVAPCYARSDAILRRLGCRFETYGFAADGFDHAVAALAERLAVQHAPDWVLAYGHSNPQLVAALDRLGLAVLGVVPEAPPTAAAGQLAVVLKHATGILLADVGDDDLGDAAIALEARRHRRIEDLAPVAAASQPRRGSLVDAIGRIFRRGLAKAGEIDGRERAAVRAIFGEGQAMAAENAARLAQARRDAETIHGSRLFCPQLAAPSALDLDTDAVMAFYLRASGHARPRANRAAGRLVRRPARGFHPLIYATDAPAFDEQSGEDPLAHFIRSGQPEGRWTHRVLDCSRTVAVDQALPRTAIHLHLHYPNLLPEILRRLEGQALDAVDLVVTTTSAAAADTLRSALADRPARVLLRPNRGRDVWPFVDLLQSGTFDGYAIVGHFHAKRSEHYALGDLWRDFLFDHLIGGRSNAMDQIRRAFADDPHLGLVFAEEPHLEGWDTNYHLATLLAERMGLTTPLPAHFDYPMGTMFWARPEALAPLHRLALTERDIPEEPVPVDGTILHAIECLVPFIVEGAGFGHMTTYVDGSTR